MIWLKIKARCEQQKEGWSLSGQARKHLNFACFVKIMYEQGSEELFCVSNNVIMVTNMQSTRTGDNKDWDLVGWYHHGACNGLILSAGRNWFLHPL